MSLAAMEGDEPAMFLSVSALQRLALAAVRQPSVLTAPREKLPQSAQRLWHRLRDDWRGTRVISFGLLLLLITTLALLAYYLNHPEVDTSADTANYVNVANNRILAGKGLVDPLRTPGYPLLITAVFLVFGRGNLFAVSIVQALLFVLTTLEIYALALFILKRAWVAFTIGVLIGINTYLLAYIKAIVVESLTLWLVATLALAVVVYVQRSKVRDLWLVAALTLALFMTRPEWVYLPVPLFAYLLFIAARRGKFRRLLPHALGAVLVLYGVLGLYIYVNGQQNGFYGITEVQRLNLVGKVLQYHMQDEAPPEYAALVQDIDTFLKTHPPDPYQLADEYPIFAKNYWELGGDYADAVVIHHPIQFVLDTLPLFLTTWQQVTSFSSISPHGPFLTPLLAINSITGDISQAFPYFPVFVLLWLGLICWRRTSRLRSVEMMCAVVLLAFYELFCTSLGGYVEFWRLHIPFEPLLILIIYGSALWALSLWGVQISRWVTIPWRVVWWLWGGLVAGVLVVNVALAWLTGGAQSAFHPTSWPVARVLAGHPTRGLIVLALVGLLTFLSYRAHRRALMVSASGTQQNQGDTGGQPLPDAVPDQVIEAN
jgi:4-amino-4-deoxy-L-arabinose transferase-like glycosyltransferase